MSVRSAEAAIAGECDDYMKEIQWFPGHMAKTGRELSESVKLADIIIEVIDSRIPKSSGNPDFDKIFAGKKRLVVLNKADLADPVGNEAWKREYGKRGVEAFTVNARSGDGVHRVYKALSIIGMEKSQKHFKRGVVGRPVRAIVAGIPNSGKSSLINRLANKYAAKTGDRPGVTKSRQWIRLDENIELMDTPGILWPKFESGDVAAHLAFTGAIRDEVYDVVEVVERLARYLLKYHRPELIKRYGDIFGPARGETEDTGNAALGDDVPGNAVHENATPGDAATGGITPKSPESPLELIGRRRGFLARGGNVDIERAATIVLDEFRAAKIGRITLEMPD